MPIRHDLEEEPEVVRIVSALCPQSVRDLSERMRTTTLVCGALQRTWRLFDKLTEDGELAGYGAEWLDSCVGIEGWSEHLQRVGWLLINEQSLVMPGFTTWLGRSAKRRLKDAQRKRESRANVSAKCPQQNGQKPDHRTEEKRTEQKSKKKSTKRKTFVKPTVQAVREYCRERNNNVNADQFIDHYESNGWLVGKNPMKDWKAAVRTWERSSSNEKQKPLISAKDLL